MTVIRPATHDDIPALSKLIKEFYIDSIYAAVSFDVNRLNRFLAFIISDANHLCAVTVDSSNRPIGTVAGLVAPLFFSEESVTWDLFLYVDPQHRGEGVARVLAEYYLSWARSKSAKLCFAGISAGRSEKAERFYQHLGLERVGANFLKVFD